MIKKPNYKNSIVNLASSFINFYGGNAPYESHALVDFILSKKYKHVALILCDGMGIKNIDDNLSNGSILKTHQIITLNSVFPPTTVSATTAFLDGRAPIESGWLGWHQYFGEDDPSIDLFSNKEHYSEKYFEGYNVKDKIPTKTFVSDLRRTKGYTIMDVGENKPETFSAAIDQLLEIFAKPESNFTYLYWTKPDSVMHEYGVTSSMTKLSLVDIETQITRLSKEIGEDTLVFVTADHGLVDVEPINLAEVNEISSLLRKPISGEGRFAQFYLREGVEEEFVSKFNELFGNDFILYSRKNFIASKLAGLYQPNKMVDVVLGDYCAIATSNYYFCNEITEDTFVFKASHAGMTKDEMEVPIILLKKKEEVEF